MRGDLTTLANAKAWAGIATTNSDVIISQLITRVSQVARSYCGRPSFLSTTYTESYDGTGDVTLPLRNWPVTSVASLSINERLIQPAGSGWAGFTFDQWDGFSPGSPAFLQLRGGRFLEGQRNVAVTYTAGYLLTGEAQTVDPATHTITPIGPLGICAADAGCTYANGTPLVAVAATPAAGQYVPPSPFGLNPTTVYQFSAADSGSAVILSYSYVPADLEGAVIELVAERVKYMARIGLRSQSSGAGGENTSYIVTDLPAWARMSLQNYKMVVPL